MFTARFSQRIRRPSGVPFEPPAPPGPPPARNKPLTAALDFGRSSSQRGLSTAQQRQLASQFDYLFHSGEEGVGTSAMTNFVSRLTTTLDYILNDQSNPYRNPSHISAIYQIPYECHGAQVVSLQRNGTTLTLVFDGTVPGLELGISHGMKLRQLVSPYDVFNGDYTTAGTGTGVVGKLLSYNNTTKTVTCEVASSGPTTQDTSRNGIGIARDRGLERFEKACEINAWTRRLGTTFRRQKWTSSFGSWDINNTLFAPTDSNGNTFAEALAHLAQNEYQWASIPGLKAFFQDNVQSIRADTDGNGDNGDWNRDGFSEDRSTMQASHRAGIAKYALKHKSYDANRIIIANADNDLSGSGWSGAYDAAIFEFAFQQSNTTLISRLVQHDHLVGSKIMVYCAQSRVANGGTGLGTDYNMMRRHFARSLVLGYDCYAFCGDDEGYVLSRRHDEMDAPLGTPVGVAVTAANGGAAGRLWVREYSNGLVVFNGSSSSDTLNVASYGNFRKLSASDIGRTPLDSTFNNGTAVTSLALAGASGGALIGEGAILVRA